LVSNARPEVPAFLPAADGYHAGTVGRGVQLAGEGVPRWGP
jgi:hypothetical protein